MIDQYQIAVIGAGPAGIAAATLAARHGASVAMIDGQARPGGQIYRNLSDQTLNDRTILGSDYYRGQPLLDELHGSGVDHIAQASVWQIGPTGEIAMSQNGTARRLLADQIILATGAMERPFPVPGWTLPGVMNAGAAQILLKASGVGLPGAVFIGTGPLLYLVVAQYLQAGIPVRAVLDTTARGNLTAALRHLPGALMRLPELLKGARWQRRIRGAKLEFVRAVEDIRLLGETELSAVEYRKGKRWTRIEATRVLLHQGIVPNANLAMAAGCTHDWNKAQLCWQARVDGWGLSSLPNLAVAGDGAHIGGAKAAEHAGRIAALGALHRLGRLDGETRDRLAAPERAALWRHMRLRPFLDALYRPADSFRRPDDDTIVCRCEEITAGQVRGATKLGCLGPNQLKSFTRAGMGPCQGRQCALSLVELIAEARGVPVSEVGHARLRSPATPLTLGEMASLHDPPDHS